jgi:hypothetical protein
MFHHKSKGKGTKGESLSSSQTCSGTSTDLFVAMVLLNFYLHVIIYYYFTASHLIYFIIVFVCRAFQPPDTDRRLFLGLCTTRASRWPECGRRDRRFLGSRTSEWTSRRLLRSRRSGRPNRRLPRSQTSRMRLVTSHMWHPTPKQGWSVLNMIHTRCQHRSIDA